MNDINERDPEFAQNRVPPAVATPANTSADHIDTVDSEVMSVASLDVETGETSDEIVATRAQIEDTRAHMSETIDAIKEKLAPSTLIADAKDAVKEAASEKAHHVAEKAHQITDVVVDKAKDVAATASNALHTATEYVSEKATPVIESAKEKIETAKEKLAPAVDTAKHVGVKVKDAGGTVVETVRMNPLPAAMIGIGLGWLLMSARRQHSSSGEMKRYNNDGNDNRYNSSGYDAYDNYGSGNPAYSESGSYRDASYGTSRMESSLEPSTGEKVKESLSHAGEAVSHFASDAKEKVSDIASNAKEKVTDLASTAKEKVTDLAGVTKEKATQTYSSLDTWVHENPLAAGACALLIGAAVGMMIPATRKENEWFGHTRDELAHKATERAHDVMDKVQNVAQTAIGTAKNALGEAKEQITAEVKQEAQNQGLASVA